jgi:plasmid stability protein
MSDQVADDKAGKKLFALELPSDLHRRMKMRCAERGVTMSKELRRLLESEFAKPGQSDGAAA